MLKPSMNELMKKVGNRYLLVNLAAQRARDLSDEAKEYGETLPEKPVKMALDEIVAGTIVYREGPKEPVSKMATPIVPDVAPIIDLDDEDEEVELLDSDEDLI